MFEGTHWDLIFETWGIRERVEPYQLWLLIEALFHFLILTSSQEPKDHCATHIFAWFTPHDSIIIHLRSWMPFYGCLQVMKIMVRIYDLETGNLIKVIEVLKDKLGAQSELFIHMVPYNTNNTLTIIDSGFGMTKIDWTRWPDWASISISCVSIASWEYTWFQIHDHFSGTSSDCFMITSTGNFHCHRVQSSFVVSEALVARHLSIETPAPALIIVPALVLILTPAQIAHYQQLSPSRYLLTSFNTHLSHYLPLPLPSSNNPHFSYPPNQSPHPLHSIWSRYHTYHQLSIPTNPLISYPPYPYHTHLH